jgi:hypothetical protein
MECNSFYAPVERSCAEVAVECLSVLPALFWWHCSANPATMALSQDGGVHVKKSAGTYELTNDWVTAVDSIPFPCDQMLGVESCEPACGGSLPSTAVTGPGHGWPSSS